MVSAWCWSGIASSTPGRLGDDEREEHHAHHDPQCELPSRSRRGERPGQPPSSQRILGVEPRSVGGAITGVSGDHGADAHHDERRGRAGGRGCGDGSGSAPRARVRRREGRLRRPRPGAGARSHRRDLRPSRSRRERQADRPRRVFDRSPRDRHLGSRRRVRSSIASACSVTRWAGWSVARFRCASRSASRRSS